MHVSGEAKVTMNGAELPAQPDVGPARGFRPPGFTPSPTAIVKITETHADGTEKVTERVMNRAARRQLMAKVKRARRKAAKRELPKRDEFAEALDEERLRAIVGGDSMTPEDVKNFVGFARS